MEVLFGPWKRFDFIHAPGLEIDRLGDARTTIASLEQSPLHSDGWIYPPLTTPTFDPRPDAPKIPVIAYELPPTHRLTLTPPYESDEVADYIIAIVGLLEGVRLTRQGWIHFLKTPIKLFSIGDLVPGPPEIAEVLRLALDGWQRASANERHRLFGAIHWFTFASLYDREFERFGGMYAVLDTLAWIHKARTGAEWGHYRRAQELALYHGMPVPAWAQVQNRECALSIMRNELVHESRYAGAPIGFAYPTNEVQDICLELQSFVQRLLLATLGVNGAYVTSVVTSRQMHGLDMIGPFQRRQMRLG